MNRADIILQGVSIVSLCLAATGAFAQQSIFDADIPAERKVRTSLNVVNRLASKHELTPVEVRQIYFAEKLLARCVTGHSQRDSAEFGDYIAPFPFYSDTNITKRCLLYVQNHRSRFHVVFDGWKGENNFFEPTGYWVEFAMKMFPSAPQTAEISFDQEFDVFIRRFSIYEEAKGKSCQQHHEEEIKDHLDGYLDVYSREEIDQWPAECERNREEFLRGRSRLLEKYNNAPFTRKLQDIDPTTIVIFHSVC